MNPIERVFLIAAGAIAAALVLILATSVAYAQTASCTTLSVGQTQDITAFGVCKKVTLNSVPAAGAASICVVTNTTAAEWASFYNSPPAGVTIAACSASCTGYSYGGYCYYYSGDLSGNSCDATCASHGGCNAAGTRYIGSDDSSAARCSAVATALAGTSVSAIASSGSDSGCGMNSFKGGWISTAYYSPTTTCASTGTTGRICACNGGGGGTAPCNLPWGGQIAHNASVTAYQSSSVPCGNSCASETRTCNNGSLSGSYVNSSCSVGSCGGDCGYDAYYYQNCQVGVGPQTNGTVQVWQEESCGYLGKVRATCTNGSYTYSNPSCSCFVGEVMITMADGSTKRMDELKIGDKVKGQSRINTVIAVPVNKTSTALYSFNGGKAFVTGGHPFMTQHGWASVEPDLSPKEGHSIAIGKLEVGDTLYLDDGSTIVLESIAAEDTGLHTVFNPMLDGDNTYYANGILVHNKAPLC